MEKYIYGIITSGEAKHFELHDITNGEGVYSIPFRDISAVVSDSAVVNCSNIHKNELAKILVTHQMTVEKIMEMSYTVIPVRLGTFAADEREIVHILTKGYKLIQEIKNKVCGKAEIDLVVTWSDFARILKETADEKEIAELKKILVLKQGGATAEDRIEIGRMVQEALDRRRRLFFEEILDAVKLIGAEFKFHECMDDKMIADIALLADRCQIENFDDIIKRLDAKFNGQLNFRCVGPLPPYSFYTLEVKKMAFAEIDWARKKLGMDKFVLENEIKKIYQKAASLCHPDKNPSNLNAEEEFNDITKAYKIVTDYCSAHQQTTEEKRLCFTEQEVKNNLLMVKVRQ